MSSMRASRRVTLSDFTALQVLGAMRELGLSAPDDWAVIGFDESGYAEMFTPTLTTLTADAEAHGRLAARQHWASTRATSRPRPAG